MPPLSIKPDAYRLVFSIYYQNRDAAKFVDAIFNETATLVPATDLGIDADMMLLAGGAAAPILSCCQQHNPEGRTRILSCLSGDGDKAE